jgi:pantoate--beta-alanine ligase
MKVVTHSSDLPLSCAFVPTMGALHAGHASLFHIAKTYSENVVASIFVNPLQFENSVDLAQYPRTPESDIEIAAQAGVTHLWLPKYEEIYPEGFTRLTTDPIGKLLEGLARPGHFDGVVTVVRRLFDLVNPKVAVFGEKDFQQLFLIKKIAQSVEIVAAPTIREVDGLAMSSRNTRLSEAGRNAAAIIYRSLQKADCEAELKELLAQEPLFELDYAVFIDEQTFLPVTSTTSHIRALVAGWIDGVRLIDNMAMEVRR